jgi:hypothetical protein
LIPVKNCGYKNSLVGAGFAKMLLVKIKNFLPNLPLHIGHQQKIYCKKKFIDGDSFCQNATGESHAICSVLGSGIDSLSTCQASKYIAITSSALRIAFSRVFPWVQGMTTRSANSGIVTKKSRSSSDH